MSNEELVARIQAGETNLYEDLWFNVERLIRWKANRVINAIGSFGGVTIEDLCNCGYLAVVKAVDTYSHGDHAFSTWLMYHLKAEFAKATGYDTEKHRKDPLQNAVSLSTPLGGDSEDICLGDTIPAPDGQTFMETIEDGIWRKQLHETLEDVLDEIPPEQSDVIRKRYYTGLTVTATAQKLGTSYSEARQLEEKGIRALRQPKIAKKIRPFYDFDYYRGTGLGAFRSTGMSVQERYMVMQERRLSKPAQDQKRP